MKIGNENSNHVLNILYANNHFEPVITCDPMIKFSNIHTCDAYMTQILKVIISIMKIMRLSINLKN
jgi:pectate lyase